jgi:hypothetical protein
MSTTASRLGALLATALLAAACSGDPVAAPTDEEPTPTTIAAPASSDAPSTTAASVAPTTAAPTADTVPETLAFASTRDLGRLYVVDPTADVTTPSSIAAGEPNLAPIADGTIVQAVEAKSRDGALWVRLVSADGVDVGWLPAESLANITETAIQTDTDAVGEFHRVVRVRSTSFLNIRSSPDTESDAVGQLGPDATFMHGGRTAVTPEGTAWVDVINSADRSEIGWVVAEFTTVADGVEIQTDDGQDAASRRESGVTYGASIASAAITSVGCNSVQITVVAESGSQGVRLLTGPAEPQAFEANGAFQWAIEGGRSAYLAAGETAVITVPSTASFTWWILPLDDDGAPVSTTATGGGTVLNEGQPDAAQAFAYPIDVNYCGDAPANASDLSIPGLEVQSSGVDPAPTGAADTGTTGTGTGAGGTADDGTSDESGPATTVPAAGDPPSAAPEGFSTTGGDR